jgi:hypothetical protein
MWDALLRTTLILDRGADPGLQQNILWHKSQ